MKLGGVGGCGDTDGVGGGGGDSEGVGEPHGVASDAAAEGDAADEGPPLGLVVGAGTGELQRDTSSVPPMGGRCTYTTAACAGTANATAAPSGSVPLRDCTDETVEVGDGVRVCVGVMLPVSDAEPDAEVDAESEGDACAVAVAEGDAPADAEGCTEVDAAGVARADTVAPRLQLGEGPVAEGDADGCGDVDGHGDALSDGAAVALEHAERASDADAAGVAERVAPTVATVPVGDAEAHALLEAVSDGDSDARMVAETGPEALQFAVAVGGAGERLPPSGDLEPREDALADPLALGGRVRVPQCDVVGLRDSDAVFSSITRS